MQILEEALFSFLLHHNEDDCNKHNLASYVLNSDFRQRLELPTTCLSGIAGHFCFLLNRCYANLRQGDFRFCFKVAKGPERMLELAEKWCSLAENKELNPVLPFYGHQLVQGLIFLDSREESFNFSALAIPSVISVDTVPQQEVSSTSPSPSPFFS